MIRRQMLFATLAVLTGLPKYAAAQAAIPGLPASSSGIVLVELANFQCPRCRAVTDRYRQIYSAAALRNIPLRFAPVAWQGQSMWPDRVYYATRDLFPEAEELIRDALFDAMQREGQLFEELAQVLAYLERTSVPQRAKALVNGFNLLAIADLAITDTTLLSEVKAGRLLDLSGASEVPVFVWVRDGQVIDTVSPSDAAEASPLVQRVLLKLKEPVK